MAGEVGKVALDIERSAAGRFDAGPYRIVGLCWQKVRVGNVTAACSQLDSDGRADAAPAAGDQGDGAFREGRYRGVGHGAPLVQLGRRDVLAGPQRLGGDGERGIDGGR